MHPRIVITTLVVLALGFFSDAYASPGHGAKTNYTTVDTHYNVSDPTVINQLSEVALANLRKYKKNNSHYLGKRGGQKCNIHKASVRKEWGTLSKSKRKAYINAVLCLMSKPSQSDPTLVPGARNRYDDFVAVHINQTLTIHATANFFSWHRLYSWKFEQALKNECGYNGSLPYWNWGKYADDPESSPIFDGSPYSMSGNGAYIANRTAFTAVGGIYIPPQNGGGCVTSGPFKDMVVNLGPVAPILTGLPQNPRADGFGYNPRCLRRDIGNYMTTHFTKISDIASLIVNPKDIGSFQTKMQGNKTFPGVHGAGHFTISGDPGGDFYTSPAEPAFFLHHSMIDYTWWIWQNLNPGQRTYTIWGTMTWDNEPPSRNGTLDDTINLGVIAPKDIKLWELMSTVDGPFCYIYE